MFRRTQQVRGLAVNQLDAGSNPAGGANLKSWIKLKPLPV